jgi:hypothetical protein
MNIFAGLKSFHPSQAIRFITTFEFWIAMEAAAGSPPSSGEPAFASRVRTAWGTGCTPANESDFGVAQISEETVAYPRQFRIVREGG